MTIKEIYAAHDRAAAIAAVSFLEPRLEAAIRRIGGAKGKGSFAQKIQRGFELGIYGSETKEDLRLIREIRNGFAHEVAIRSFEEPAIKDHCGNLKLIDRYIFDREMPEDQILWVKGLTVKIEGRDARMALPRERYFATVGLISTALHPPVMEERDHSQGLGDSATGLP
jgi:hypothetical protein